MIIKKKLRDLTYEEIIKIHNNTSCHNCPLKDYEGNCIRTGVTYNFDNDYFEREVKVEKEDDCIHKP